MTNELIYDNGDGDTANQGWFLRANDGVDHILQTRDRNDDLGAVTEAHAIMEREGIEGEIEVVA